MNEYWYEYLLDEQYLNDLGIEYDEVYSEETMRKVKERLKEL